MLCVLWCLKKGPQSTAQYCFEATLSCSTHGGHFFSPILEGMRWHPVLRGCSYSSHTFLEGRRWTCSPAEFYGCSTV